MNLIHFTYSIYSNAGLFSMCSPKGPLRPISIPFLAHFHSSDSTTQKNIYLGPTIVKIITETKKQKKKDNNCDRHTMRQMTNKKILRF